MKPFDVYPLNDITITKSEGSFVYDDKGQKYLDMYGGHAVISIGHRHPHWIKRIQDQLSQIPFYSNSVKIPLQIELAEKLGIVSGKTNYQLFMCNSGAEANENAIKLASFYNKRKVVIAFSNSFHGRTSLAVAATDNPSILAPVNETRNILFLPFNNQLALMNAFKNYQVSSVIVEAIQGVGGINTATVSFLKAIRMLCDQHYAVMIADEVQCGYGRSGQFFALDYANIEADIYTMAKGMGNGFPVAAIAISPKFKAQHFMLGTTFGGNHLACAASLAVLEVIQQDKLMDNALCMGDYLIDELKKLPAIAEVRGKGLIIGIELPAHLGEVRKNLLHKHKIFTGESKPNVIRLLPPLNISKAEIDIFLAAIKEELQINNKP